MSYEPKRVEHKNGTVSKIHFDCERKELREIADDLQDIIESVERVEDSVIIRRKKKNPVIKANKGDKVYLRWSEDGASVKVELADPPIPQAVSAYFASKSPEGDEKFPWDADEMEQYAKGLVRMKQEKEEEDEQDRERVREDTNHRDDYQREPKDKTGAKKGGAEIVDGKTVFQPPFSKQNADYHPPGEGEHVHLDCKDCVHYIEGGACHMVEGEIDPDAHCEDLFADMGLFARMYEGEFQINLAMWGDMFRDRFSRVDFNVVANRVKEAIQRKL